MASSRETLSGGELKHEETSGPIAVEPEPLSSEPGEKESLASITEHTGVPDVSAGRSRPF